MEGDGSRAVCDPGVAIALFLAAVVPAVKLCKHCSGGGCGRVAFICCLLQWGILLLCSCLRRLCMSCDDELIGCVVKSVRHSEGRNGLNQLLVGLPLLLLRYATINSTLLYDSPSAID